MREEENENKINVSFHQLPVREQKLQIVRIYKVKKKKIKIKKIPKAKKKTKKTYIEI